MLTKLSVWVLFVYFKDYPSKQNIRSIAYIQTSFKNILEKVWNIVQEDYKNSKYLRWILEPWLVSPQDMLCIRATNLIPYLKVWVTTLFPFLHYYCCCNCIPQYLVSCQVGQRQHTAQEEGMEHIYCPQVHYEELS